MSKVESPTYSAGQDKGNAQVSAQEEGQENGYRNGGVSFTLSPQTHFSACDESGNPTISYNDLVCHHNLYYGFFCGKYTDLRICLISDHSNEERVFNLHRLNATLSPYLDQILKERENRCSTTGVTEIILRHSDSNLTPEGFYAALSHLYMNFFRVRKYFKTQNNLQHVMFLSSVVSAGLFLKLRDLVAVVLELLKESISPETVTYLSKFVYKMTATHRNSQVFKDLEDRLFQYISKEVIENIADDFDRKFSGNREHESYKALVKMFSDMPFEMLKKVMEHPDLAIPSEPDRFNFAKDVISLRKCTAYMPQSPVIFEENALLEFGSSRHGKTVITITKKPLMVKNEKKSGGNLGEMPLTPSSANLSMQGSKNMCHACSNIKSTDSVV